MNADSATATGIAAPLLSYLVVAVSALLAGVVLGGWLAFETGHWQEFKAGIEGLAGGSVALAGGLLFVAVVASVGGTYLQVGKA